MAKIVYAKTKYVGQSAQKVRLVADLVRGKNALLACDILMYTNKAAAKEVFKTLNSAIANAVHNESMNKKSLVVKEIFVNEAPTFKRGIAVSKGRYHQILKRNSHIVVGVTDNATTEIKVTKQEIEKEAKQSVKVKKTTKVKKTAEKKPVKKASKAKVNSKSK